MTGSEGDEGNKGPSKFKIGKLAWTTYSDLKKLMDGDPIGAVGLFGDAGKWAQLLIPEAVATPVIEGGLMVLTGISKTMGVGSPDGGGAFSDGAKLFQSNGKSLESAYPTESWSGAGSDAYMSQNSHQIQRASTMLEADNSIVRILTTQAGQVDHARTQVDWASKGLAAVIPVAMALEATVFGAPESIALQVAAVATASAVAGAASGNLLSYAQDNAAQIREATAKYRQAGAVSSSGTVSVGSPSGGGGSGAGGSSGTGAGGGLGTGAGGGAGSGGGSQTGRAPIDVSSGAGTANQAVPQRLTTDV